MGSVLYKSPTGKYKVKCLACEGDGLFSWQYGALTVCLLIVRTIGDE